MNLSSQIMYICTQFHLKNFDFGIGVKKMECTLSMIEEPHQDTTKKEFKGPGEFP
ncbi:hypothetical protein TNCT_473421, partial [Trichonephila clavata]